MWNIYIYTCKKHLAQLITSHYLKNVRTMEFEVMLMTGTGHTYSIDHSMSPIIVSIQAAGIQNMVFIKVQF